MLMNRVFEPSPDQIIYHYCSAQTFDAILKSRTLRFSDINMMNDAYETSWGYSAFEEAATRLIKRIGVSDSAPIIGTDFFNSVDSILSPVQLIAHPFISCFSLENNSLGQWRAYADDGRGFAIGFKASHLKDLGVTMLSVEYDREEQIKEIIVALCAIHLHCNGDPDSSPKIFFEDCALLGTYMVALKHHAFTEEQEIRCVRAVKTVTDNNSIRFADPGGETSTGQQIEGRPIQFTIRDNHFCASLDLPFSFTTDTHPIAEIVMGPKNFSAPGNIACYLGGLGLTNIKLKQSDSPYR